MEQGPGAMPTEPRSWLSRCTPSLTCVVFLSVFAMTALRYHPVLFARDGDVGRHIRIGEWMLDHRGIPDVDLFSHTCQGQRFVPYEWLSELAFGAAHRMCGLTGVVLLTAALFALAGALLYRMARDESGSVLPSVAVALYGMRMSKLHLLARPHMFTIVLAAATCLLLLRHRRDPRARTLVAVPFLMLLWANLHGAFLVGIVLLGIFGLEALIRALVERSARARARLRHLSIAGVTSLVATLANPAGIELWAHVVGYLRTPFLVDVTIEYQSPNFHDATVQPFLVALVVIVLVLMVGRIRCALVEILLFVFWFSSALYTARNIPLFAVLVLPMVARWLAEGLRTLAAGEGAVGGCFARVERADRELTRIDARCATWLPATVLQALLCTHIATGVPARTHAFSPEAFPVTALEKLKGKLPAGNVFNHFQWGGYLLYAAPEVPVFIDGQTDFYGEALTRKYLRIVQLGPGWKELLDEHDIRWTLTQTGQPLNRALELSPGWQRVYQDATATIFKRL